jgi:hypothetical protein
MVTKEKITRENIGEHLVRYQLAMIGKTFEEALKDDMWIFNWTCTQEQADEFKKYAIPLIKKTFKCNKGRSEGIFGWFNLQFGLKIKD